MKTILWRQKRKFWKSINNCHYKFHKWTVYDKFINKVCFHKVKSSGRKALIRLSHYPETVHDLIINVEFTPKEMDNVDSMAEYITASMWLGFKPFTLTLNSNRIHTEFTDFCVEDHLKHFFTQVYKKAMYHKSKEF